MIGTRATEHFEATCSYMTEDNTNRREMFGVAGVTALGLAAMASSRSRADEKEDGHKEHGQIHPCAKACAECANQCNSCFDHCVELVAGGAKEHTASLRSCADCAELCSAAATA
jgi:hypothetical protein